MVCRSGGQFAGALLFPNESIYVNCECLVPDEVTNILMYCIMTYAIRALKTSCAQHMSSRGPLTVRGFLTLAGTVAHKFGASNQIEQPLIHLSDKKGHVTIPDDNRDQGIQEALILRLN